MKKISRLNLFISIFLLATSLFTTACNSNVPASSANPPTSNLDATVNAQVQATLAAASNTFTIDQQDNQPVSIDTNPPLALPFNDNFDAGLDNNWRVLSGNPIIMNGKLGATLAKDVYLEIGNNDLHDYSITFDVAGDNYSWGGSSSDLFLSLTPYLQAKLSSAGPDSRVTWIAFEDDEWEKINTTKFKQSDTANFKIIVSGNTYTVHANGQVVSELVYGSARNTGAPLILQIYGNGIWLDNFSIH